MLLFLPYEDPHCGGCRLAVRWRAAGTPGAGCADHEAPEPDRAPAEALNTTYLSGNYRDEAPELAPDTLREVARLTARLWRGLGYQEAITVSALARGRLGLERPRIAPRPVERLTRAEVERLISHAYTVRGDRGLMLQTLLLTGARVSELVAIEVRDVDVAGRTVTIRRGKGGKQRTVPILPRLAEHLAIHTAHRRGGEPLFRARGRLPRPLSRRRVQQLMAELAAGARIGRRVYPHLLRHTIAQHLLEGGMPLEQVGQFLGHRYVTTTQIYAEPSAAMIATSYRRALEE